MFNKVRDSDYWNANLTATPFQRPVELTCYTLDADRKFRHDDSGMRYYDPLTPRFTLPLNAGYPDKYVEADATARDHLDTLLMALRGLTTSAKGEFSDADISHVNIITWRGIMTKLCCLPYSANSPEPLRLRAMRHGDTLYIEECQKEPETYASEADKSRHHEMSYYGYRFETFCTRLDSQIGNSGRAEFDKRCQETVNTNQQYCTVIKTKLGRHSVIMGAEGIHSLYFLSNL